MAEEFPDILAETPVLESLPFLRGASRKALRLAASEARYFSLPGGWKLFDVGEPSDTLYFVLTGSLGAFRPSHSGGPPELVGHIRAGEPVGEMSLMAATPHQHAVYAIRDSEMLAISRSSFRRLIRSAPEILERITRTILVRMRQASRRPRSAEPKVFALISASPTIDLKLRSGILAAQLSEIGLRVATIGEEAAGRPAAFFDEVEKHHDIVFLLTAIGDTAWFKFSQRHADRIWVFGRADARPSSPLLPDDPSPARGFRLADIILLHHGKERTAGHPSEWMSAANAARLFHWVGVDTADAARLARTIAGRSVGLVLSGGGARAYSHIGVMRALSETGIPIDFTGGTSMGGVIAASYALGWSLDEIERRIQDAFVKTNPLSDYHLPVVALLKGMRVRERLREHFGDVDIETMRLPFFCVSTNLTQGAPRVHTSGLLRTALRASISLPGILPPVVCDGQVLVDGAVMNNLPIDVMRDMHRGRIIGVDAAQPPEGLRPDDFVRPSGFLAWTAKNGFSSPPPIANLLMRTATLSLDTVQKRELADLVITPRMEGVELRDWKAYDFAVEAGYTAARESLAQLNSTTLAEFSTKATTHLGRAAVTPEPQA